MIRSASLNASACYYQCNDLTQAARTLESLIFRDPAFGFDRSVLSSLICIYNELYVPEERLLLADSLMNSELKCRALFSLSQRYHIELLTQKDFSLGYVV